MNELDRINNKRKLVNSNIPQGRGMVKWLPMATMPEQYENITKIIDKNNMIPPPAFDNDTLIRLEQELRNSINKVIVLRYWSEGFELHLQCKLEYVDDDSRLIIINKDNEIMAVKFDNIYEIIS